MRCIEISSYVGPVYQTSSTVSNVTVNLKSMIFDKIQFGYCPYSLSEWFDITTGIFSSGTTGLYWFHLSAGVPPFTKALYGIQNSPSDFIGINKSNTMYPKDQVSTDALRWVSAESKLSVATSYTLNNDALLSQTSWLWLRLNSFIKPLVAFHVILTTSISLIEFYPIPFDRVLVNEGGGWNLATSKFSPPVLGIYYFTFGVASTSENKAAMIMMLNDHVKIYIGVYEIL